MSESSVRAALGSCELFAGVEPSALEGVAGLGQEVSFGADEVIFSAGDPADGMYIVLDGEAQVDVGGRFHRLEAGDFFGEMSLLGPDKRMATVRAATPVRAVKIASGDFHGLLLRNPEVAVSMLRELVLRLREVEQRIDAWMAPAAESPRGGHSY